MAILLKRTAVYAYGHITSRIGAAIWLAPIFEAAISGSPLPAEASRPQIFETVIETRNTW